jgi:CHAT domain
MIVLAIRLVEQGRNRTAVFLRGDRVGEVDVKKSVSTTELLLRGRVLEACADRRAPGDEVERLGRGLFEYILGTKGRRLYDSARDRASEGKEHLLLQIELAPESSIQAVPWELLHDGQQFLAKSRGSALVRWIKADKPVPKLASRQCLRVLMTSASPISLGMASVGFDAEENELRKALKSYPRHDLVVEHHLSQKKLAKLWRLAYAQGRPFHLWHHAGHGALSRDGQYFLVLESAGKPDLLKLDRLQDILGEGSGLRVAVLQTCFSADRFGLARELARLQVPVVVGFRKEISAVASRDLVEAFYQTMFKLPPELAATEGRLALGDREWNEAIVISRRSDTGLLMTQETTCSAPGAYGPLNVFNDPNEREKASEEQRKAVKSLSNKGGGR